MFEEARAMAGTMKLCTLTQSELAARMGVSQSYVANKLRLLGYSGECEALILSSGISERHARAILRISDEGERRNMITRVAEGGLTVRECEALVEAHLPTPSLSASGKATDKAGAAARLRELIRRGARELNSLGIDAEVSVSYFGKKCYLTLSYTE